MGKSLKILELQKYIFQIHRLLVNFIVQTKVFTYQKAEVEEMKMIYSPSNFRSKLKMTY